jgi:hypothetical protein
VIDHVAEALNLLTRAQPAVRNRSDRMLEQAQVHATLAVEQAVRDLIERMEQS